MSVIPSPEYGDTISLSVAFDDMVTVTGMPRLPLKLDGCTPSAAFHGARRLADGVLGPAVSASAGASVSGDASVFTYSVVVANNRSPHSSRPALVA